MLLGITKATSRALASARRNVENQRSKTPSPNSPLKADEIWLQRESSPSSDPELFTVGAGAAARGLGMDGEDRFPGAVEARRFERGEIERGM